MLNSFNLKSIAFTAVLFTAITAFAHVTLEQPQVETGTNYKAVLRVGHGCEGLPTTTVRVQLPAGFQGAKPMPKAGWTAQTKLEKIATPYESNGKTILEDITEITWTVKAPEFALKDSEYDEFGLRGRTAMPAGAAWFKITQLCQDGGKTGSLSWSEIPASGASTRGMKYPAAKLEVTSAAPATSSVGATSPQPAEQHKH